MGFFEKELLPIVVSFKEWIYPIHGNTNQLKLIVYTNNCDLKIFMTTKQLAKHNSWWAETMGWFDFYFEIKFQPGQNSTKPDVFPRLTDWSLKKDDTLSLSHW